jgi:D-hexose-6-phosphate mutarotase
MGDLGEENFRKFVCVEVGTVVKDVQLAAGSTWIASQTLTLL